MKAFRLGLFLLFLASAFLVARYVVDQPLVLPEFAESSLVVVFGAASVLLVCSLFERLTPLLGLFVLTAVSFGWFWGRFTFLSNFEHDEFGYFALFAGQTLRALLKNLLVPLNEHFIPLFNAHNAILIGLFGTEYFGFAAAVFLDALGIMLMLGWVASRLTRFRILPALFLLFLGSQQFVWGTLDWKAGALPVLLPTLLFLALVLWAIVELRSAGAEAQLSRVLVSLILLTGTILTSSLITLPVIYLAPLAVLGLGTAGRRFRWWRYYWLLVFSIAASMAYFAARRVYGGLAEPTVAAFAVVPFVEFIGRFFSDHLLGLSAFAQAPFAFGVAGLGVLSLLAVGWLFVAIRETRGSEPVPLPDASLRLYFFLLGCGMFFIGMLQVYVGRGAIWPMALRHAFFPVLGLYLAIFSLLCAAADFVMGERRISPRLEWAALLLGGAIFVAQGIAFHRSVDFAARAKLREERTAFANGLEAVLCDARRNVLPGIVVYLPALGIARIPGSLGLHYPFNAEERGFTIEFVARAHQLPCFDTHTVQFVPPDMVGLDVWRPLCRDREAVACRFLERYFPDFHRALTGG